MMAFKNAFLITLGAFVLLISISQASVAQPAEGAFAAEEDFYELVLQVERNKKILSRTILGLQRGYDEYYLPVGAMTDLLKIKADVDLANGKVAGWYLKEGYPFEIDVKNGYYMIRGEPVNLAPGDGFVRGMKAGLGDVYLSYDIFSEIFPLDMTFDFSKLSLRIDTDTKLPYEKIALRKERREQLLERQNSAGIDITGFKVVDNPYKMFSKPVLDINTSTRWDNDEREVNHSTNIAGRSDLLGFSADYGLNLDYEDGSFEAPDLLRMTLTKRAYDEPMPLGVREVRLGDVSAPTPTLIRGSNSGRGVSVSSRPVIRKGVFDEVIVDGIATPGWEVELYRGNELLEFGTVDETGLYRFENVQLQTGGSTIKVLLHGPEGQLEERVERYNIGNLLKPGAAEYQASFVDTKSPTIVFDKDELGGNNNGTNDRFAYSGSATVGVNRWMSLFATGSNAITREGNKKYVTAGADLSIGGVRANIEGYQELGSGNAIDVRAATNILGWRANFKTQLLNDFESNAVGFEDNARVFNVEGNLSKRFDTTLGRVNVSASADHERLEDESSTTSYKVNKGIAFGGQSYGNRLMARYRNHDLNDIDGLFNAKYRIGRNIRTRARVSYDVWPEFDFRDLTADIDYRHSKDLHMGLDINQSLQTSRTSVGANISYDFKKFLGALTTKWTRGDGFDFGLRASTSLAPYGPDGDYVMASKSLRSRSALNSRLYLDKNLNDVYDYGDVPISEANMIINKKDGAATDEHGISNNIEGARNDYVALMLDEETTDNPFYKSYYPGYSVLLRRGVAQDVDFPVVETGVIDGTAYFEDGNPVPGLTLQLVNHDGEVLQETITSYDGFYNFEFVKPGGYVVRTDPSQNLNMRPRLATVSPDALFAYGVNVRLLEQGGLAPSSIEVDPGMAHMNQYPIIGALVRLQSKLRGAVSGS